MGSSARKSPPPASDAQHDASPLWRQAGADTLDARVAWLSNVRLFQTLKSFDGAIAYLASRMDLKHFPTDAAIITEGEEGQDAFFLVDGTIKVLKSMSGGDKFPVALLAAKDHPFFGEAALLQADRRSATILTETPCSCLVMSKSTFEGFCAANSTWALPLALMIARVVLDRFHRTNDDVVLLYNALLSEVKGWNG